MGRRHRLRHREGGAGAGAHHDRRNRGHADLHEPRAVRHRRGDRRVGPVLARRGGVRDVDGDAAVSRRLDHVRHVRTLQPAAASRHGATPRLPPESRGRGHAHAGEGTGTALAQHGRRRRGLRPAVAAARRSDPARDDYTRAERRPTRRPEDADQPDRVVARADTSIHPPRAALDLAERRCGHRRTRLRAGARDTEARRVAEPPPPAPPPAPAPQPAAPPPVAADPRPDIEKVIADYAGALESRDIEQVRHAYPGLTGAQQGSWQTFFDRVRNLKANLAIANLNIAGASADATVSGVYEYDNASTGRAERRTVTFRVTLARDANGWRISAVR